MKFYFLSAILHFLALAGVSFQLYLSPSQPTDWSIPMIVDVLPDSFTNHPEPIRQPKKQNTKKRRAPLRPSLQSSMDVNEEPEIHTTASEESHRHSHAEGSSHELKMTYTQALNVFVSQHKRYPRRARKLKQTGTVRVRFHVTASGKFEHVHLEEGCNHQTLNNAALELIKQLGAFKPLPGAVAEGMEFIIPIRYQMKGGS